MRRFGVPDVDGYDLVLRSNAPPGSGLGSSSTMMVALTGLLAEHHGAPLSEYETAHLANVIEREDLGISGGLQDHYAATFGGFNFLEFGEQVIVNPLRVRDEVVHELEMGLMLCFTGITRASSRVIDDQSSRVLERRHGHPGRAARAEGAGGGHEVGAAARRAARVRRAARRGLEAEEADVAADLQPAHRGAATSSPCATARSAAR